MNSQFTYVGKSDIDSKEIKQLARQFCLPVQLHKGKVSVGAHIAKLANDGNTKAIYACLFYPSLFTAPAQFDFQKFFSDLSFKKGFGEITFTITPCDLRRLPVFRRQFELAFGFSANDTELLSFSLPVSDALILLHMLRYPSNLFVTNKETVINAKRQLRVFLYSLRNRYSNNGSSVRFSLSCNDPFFNTFYYFETKNINQPTLPWS